MSKKLALTTKIGGVSKTITTYNYRKIFNKLIYERGERA